MFDFPLLRSMQLENGLQVHVHDATRHYFGGYWQVALEVRCQVPLQRAVFEDAVAEAEARRLLGDTVSFVRRIERMAVLGSEQDEVRAGLVERFEQHLLPFLSSEQFPVRFIAAELRQRRKRIIHGVPCLQ